MEKRFIKPLNHIKNLRIMIFFMSILACISCDNKREEHDSQKNMRIEHLVLFKFRPNITQAEKQEIINRFMALKNSLKNGKRYHNIEFGFQNSKEGLSQGLEIGFRVTFSSEEDRDYYVGKPFLSLPGTYDQDHDAFKSFVGPYLDPNQGVLVFDYNSNIKGNESIADAGYRLDHWVLFKFKKNSTSLEKQEVINRFLALKKSKKNGIPYISFLEYGFQNSKENLDRGYEVGFRISFTSEAERDYYVGKPFFSLPGTYDKNHDAFKKFVRSYLDPNNGAFVFDYQVIR